jgi:hypothetical protein
VKELEDSKYQMLAVLFSIAHGLKCVPDPRHDIQNLLERGYKRERDSRNILQDRGHGDSCIPSWAGGLVKVIWVCWLKCSWRDRMSVLNDGNGWSGGREIIRWE